MGSLQDHILSNLNPSQLGSVDDKLLAYFSSVFTGNGSPEGVITAPIGSTYQRLDGISGATNYIKSTGSGNTGWTAVAAGVAPAPFTDALTVGEPTMERQQVISSAVALVSGGLLGRFFTAKSNAAVTQVKLWSGTTGSTLPTLVRIGLWTADAAGNLIALVASTPNDTAVLAAGGTAYTKALSAGYTFIQGQRYYGGLLVVATTPPQMTGKTNLALASIGAESPMMGGTLTGQADLPANGAMTSITQLPYMVFI